MTLLLELDEITHAKTLEVCLILKYSKSSTLHDLPHHLFSSSSSQSLPSFSFASSCLHLLSSPAPLHFLPISSSSSFLAICWFISTHPTRLLTVSLWRVWERSGRTSLWWKLIKHFRKIHPHGWGGPERPFLMHQPRLSAHARLLLPVCYHAHARLLPRACPIWSSLSAGNPFAPPHFSCKSQPCGLRTVSRGM